MKDKNKKIMAGIGLVGGGAAGGGAYYGGKYLSKALSEIPPELKKQIGHGAFLGGTAGAALLGLLLLSGVLNSENTNMRLPPGYSS